MALKKLLAALLALMLLFGLSACSLKDTLQDATRDALSGERGASSSGGAALSSDDYDQEFLLYIDGSDQWTPFPGKTGVRFSVSTAKVIATKESGATIAFTGAQEGEAVITATYDGTKRTALVRVRAVTGNSGGSTWTLHFDELTTIDVMGLATVDYDIDLTATHKGTDMFGDYTGSMGMEYDANLDTMAMLLTLAGGSVDYDTDGWFKNTDFKMTLMPHTDDLEDAFRGTLTTGDAASAAADLALVEAYLGDAFSGLSGTQKDFEKNGKPAGIWYDWSFHPTEGDMSAYFHMMNIGMGMVTGSASQDASGQNASGVVDVAGLAIGGAVIVQPVHEAYSYEDETPFPYTIEVYPSGEAVFTLYAVDSPITVKFYGTLKKG